MSLLLTKTLGSVSLDQAYMHHFADGLYGFPEEKEFALLEDGDDSPFLWLQSTKQADLAFVVIDPSLFCGESYVPGVSSVDLEMMEVKDLSECFIYVIVTIPSDRPQDMTANLQGPVLLNRSKKIGRQIISLDNNHQTRVPIINKLEN